MPPHRPDSRDVSVGRLASSSASGRLVSRQFVGTDSGVPAGSLRGTNRFIPHNETAQEQLL